MRSELFDFARRDRSPTLMQAQGDDALAVRALPVGYSLSELEQCRETRKECSWNIWRRAWRQCDLEGVCVPQTSLHIIIIILFENFLLYPSLCFSPSLGLSFTLSLSISPCLLKFHAATPLVLLVLMLANRVRLSEFIKIMKLSD